MKNTIFSTFLILSAIGFTNAKAFAGSNCANVNGILECGSPDTSCANVNGMLECGQPGQSCAEVNGMLECQ